MSAPDTSASPPVFASGAISAEMKQIRRGMLLFLRRKRHLESLIYPCDGIGSRYRALGESHRCASLGAGGWEQGWIRLAVKGSASWSAAYW